VMVVPVVDGIRTAKQLNTDLYRYLVDANRPYAQVLEEYKESNLVASYVYGDDLISQDRGGLSYYLYDGQLSARQLVDDTGVVTDSYDYDAFGNLLHSSGSTVNNYRYTGEQFDPNAGFYYLRARYYDQANGRFTGLDPYAGRMHEPITLHRYLYAADNPVMNMDPSGENYTLAGQMSALSLLSMTLVRVGLSAQPIITNVAKGILVSLGVTTIYQVIQASRSKALDDARTQEKEKAERNKKRKNGRLLFHYTATESRAIQIMTTGVISVAPASGPFPTGSFATDLAGWLGEQAITRSELTRRLFSSASPGNYARTTFCIVFQEYPKKPFKKIFPAIYYRAGSAKIIPITYFPTLLGEN
ncbi:MAG: RHS repeat-associated core domain-containing protein, partial [Candidatus Electrothrix sp. AX2]|nr:RHS repeat-associated core domain-containing protein [Candidatus Electrothrix gigas]